MIGNYSFKNEHLISYLSNESMKTIFMRERFARRYTNKKAGYALFAALYAKKYADELDKLDIVQLSELMYDIGYARRKRNDPDYKNAWERYRDVLFAKIRAYPETEKTAEMPLWQRESYCSAIETYRKAFYEPLPHDVYEIAHGIQRRLKGKPVISSVTLNQIKNAEFKPLPMAEIEALGAAFFAEAKKLPRDSEAAKNLRKQGNKAISQGCAEYADQYLNSDENLDRLSVPELVYLHKNLRLNKRYKELTERLDALCERQLRQVVTGIQSDVMPQPEVFKALCSYCHYHSRDFEKRKGNDALFKIGNLKSSLARLERIQERLNKPEKNEAVPLERPMLAQNFEQACENRQIRFDKPEKPDGSYRLYAPHAPEDADPCGTLTIAGETNINLDSGEFEHFAALAEAAKKSGSPAIVLGELSPDAQKAKKFAALMVLAGYKVRMEVEHNFSMEELAEVEPEIRKMEDLKRLKAEINKAKIRMQIDKNNPEAKNDFKMQLRKYSEYIIEFGDIYDSRSKEQRKQAFQNRQTTAKGKPTKPLNRGLER